MATRVPTKNIVQHPKQLRSAATRMLSARLSFEKSSGPSFTMAAKQRCRVHPCRWPHFVVLSLSPSLSLSRSPSLSHSLVSHTLRATIQAETNNIERKQGMAMAAAVVCARGKIEVLFIENSAYTSCISEIQLEKIDRRGEHHRRITQRGWPPPRPPTQSLLSF
mgnify:CR=1 FL=1